MGFHSKIYEILSWAFCWGNSRSDTASPLEHATMAAVQPTYPNIAKFVIFGKSAVRHQGNDVLLLIT